MKPYFRPEALDNWRSQEQIILLKIQTLESELSEQRNKLAETRAYMGVCRTPPSARNVLFTHQLIGMSGHFENARRLGYPYVAWNHQVFTAQEVLVGELKDFDL